MHTRLWLHHAWRARLLLGLILAGTLFASPAAAPPVAQALGQIVAQQNISNTSDNSEAPHIARGGGKLAAIWGERFNQQIGFDRTDLDTSFGDATFLDTGTNTQYQWPSVVVDGSGTAHIVYAVGNVVYHR